MENKLHKKNARNIKVKAITLTALFYCLIAIAFAINSKSEGTVNEYLIEPVKEWFNKEEAPDTDKQPRAKA